MVNVPKCHQISSDEININKTLCHLNKNANISKKNTNNSKQDTYQYKLVLRGMIYIFYCLGIKEMVPQSYTNILDIHMC